MKPGECICMDVASVCGADGLKTLSHKAYKAQCCKTMRNQTTGFIQN